MYVDVSVRLYLYSSGSKVDWRTVDDVMYEDGMEVQPAAFIPVSGRIPAVKEPTRVRTEFPETWLWSESSAGYQPSDACCFVCCEV